MLIPSHPRIEEMISMLASLIREGTDIMNSGNEEAIQDFRSDIIDCNFNHSSY
jgi:hypothetical protein